MRTSSSRQKSPPHQREKRIYDEASLQAGNRTRDERWFCACSKHRKPINDTEDLPRSIANTIGATEPGCDVAVEHGPDAVLEPDTVVFYDSVGDEFEQSGPIDRYSFEQRAGNQRAANRSKHEPIERKSINFFQPIFFEQFAEHLAFQPKQFR